MSVTEGDAVRVSVGEDEDRDHQHPGDAHGAQRHQHQHQPDQKLLPARAVIDVPLAAAIVGLGIWIVLAPSSGPGLTPPM